MNTPLITIVSDAREWSRFAVEPGTHFVAIWDGEVAETLSEICDESLGGVCLRMPGKIKIEEGKEFRIAYAGEVLVGTARHVLPLSDGTLRVGFSCRKSECLKETN